MNFRLNLCIFLSLLGVLEPLDRLNGQTKMAISPQLPILDSIVLMRSGGLTSTNIFLNRNQIVAYDPWQNSFKTFDHLGNKILETVGIPAKELGCGSIEFVPIPEGNGYFATIHSQYFELDDSFSIRKNNFFDTYTRQNDILLGDVISRPHTLPLGQSAKMVRGMLVLPGQKQMTKLSYPQILDTAQFRLGIWEIDAKGKNYKLKKQIGQELTADSGPIPHNVAFRFEICNGPQSTFYSGFSLTPDIGQYDFEGNLIRTFGQPGNSITQPNPVWDATTLEEDVANRFCFYLHTNMYGQIYFDPGENYLYRVYEIAEAGNYPDADCLEMENNTVVMRNAQKKRALQIYDLSGEPQLIADFPVHYGFHIVGKLNGKIAFTQGIEGRISTLLLGEFQP